MSSSNVLGQLDETFGCLTLGALFAMALWGVGSVQTYYYFDRYRMDSVLLRMQVFAIWALETAHQALILGSLYRYLVTHYADTTYLVRVDSMLLDSVILTGIIAVVVQSVFVDRIYCLSKNNLILTGATAMLALGQLVVTILYYVKVHSSATFADIESQRTYMRIDNVISTVTNAVIAATLVHLYFVTKTGFKKKDSMPNKIVAFTVNTGVVTAVCTLACMIASFASPHTFVYLLFYLVLARLYMNSVMSSLNARSIRSGGSTTDGSGTPGRNFRMADIRDTNRPEISSFSIRPTGGPRIVTIKVDTETILDHDLQKGNIGRPESDHDDSSYSPAKGTAF